MVSNLKSESTMLGLIMLVDEDDIDLMINLRVIKKAKFASEPLLFTSPRESLDYLLENKDNPNRIPELVFLDINMPKMNGFDFLEEFKTLPDSIQEKCKVVMLSSSIHPSDVEKAQTYPQCIKYMNKPLSRASLSNLTDFISQQ